MRQPESEVAPPAPIPTASGDRAAPKPQGPVDDLVAAIVAAGGRLVVQRSRSGRSDYEYHQLIQSAQRYGKVPAGKRLTSKALAWPDMEIRLEEAIPGTDAPLLPVPVLEQVSRYHPVVVAFRADPRCHDLSKQLLTRALRLLHALVTEAERRGHSVANVPIHRNAYGYTSWTPSREGHITVTVGRHSSALRLREHPAPGTNSSAGFPAAGSGRLGIDICDYSAREGRTFRWADRKSWQLEDKLPDVLREIEIRAAEDEHRRVQAEHAAAERRRRWETAMIEAKEAMVEADRAEQLRRQAHQWREAHGLRAYVAAMKDTIEAISSPDERHIAQQWLSWAESHVATLDPLSRRLIMPTPPEATPDALKPFLHGWSAHGPDSSYSRW
jgi:hypothetical protein